MKDVAVYEAKTRLSALLAEVEQGAQFTITRRGQPVAHLISAGAAAVPAAANAAPTQRDTVAAAFAALAQLQKAVSLDIPLRDAIAHGRD